MPICDHVAQSKFNVKAGILFIDNEFYCPVLILGGVSIEIRAHTKNYMSFLEWIEIITNV